LTTTTQKAHRHLFALFCSAAAASVGGTTDDDEDGTIVGLTTLSTWRRPRRLGPARTTAPHTPPYIRPASTTTTTTTMAVDSGIGRDGGATGVTLIAVIIFISLALYNVVELNLIIYATFKVRRSLYFWSFVVSTWAIAVYGVGFLLKALQSTHPELSNYIILYATLIVIGWTGMVTGQSVVLYSRLHIVVHNHRVLRGVLCMIIVNAVICHVPIGVMVYGANSAHPDRWITPYSIYEKVQVTIFFIQEMIISGVYVFNTIKLMRVEASLGRDKGARAATMSHLIWVNILIMVLDITILALEYAGLYEIQTAYKALVYSVKLKLEFSILNRLVELTQSSRSDSSYARKHGYVKSGMTRGGKHGHLGGGGAGPSGAKDVPLRTLNGKEPEGDAQWEAYAHAGTQEEGGAGARSGTSHDMRHEGQVGVIKTIEVVIEAGRHSSGNGSDHDGDSIEDKMGEFVPAQPRARSPASSETQFATKGH
jgi:hypothetical protein